MSIAQHEPRPIPAVDELLTDITCPTCGEPIARRLRLAVESVRRAAKRPVTPELLHVCAGCGRMLIVSLHPASGAPR